MTEYYASMGIDRYIKEKFFDDNSFKGIMIEVGGGEPEFLSMSRYFKNSGWNVYIVEPNPDLCKLHKEMNNIVFEVACLDTDKEEIDFVIVTKNDSSLSVSSVSPKTEYMNVAGYSEDSVEKRIIKVKQKTLDTIINENNIKNIDIITIDVEGYELEVMKGLSVILPKIVVLENIFDDQEYHNYMDTRGYILDSKIGENHIYILKK